MLIEVDPKYFKSKLPNDPHPFVSENFIKLNQNKVDRIVRLIEDSQKISFGLVAGIKDNMLLSPFSSPFGGFHFQHSYHYASDLDDFVVQLKDYTIRNNFQKIRITLPPDIYHQSFNTKTINSLLRMGFDQQLPDITNWVDLRYFKEIFSIKTSREYLNQATRNQLKFNVVNDEAGKQQVYDLVHNNRKMFGRPIHMTFNDILKTSELWPVDFFCVEDVEGNMAASAIFYLAHPSISFAVFWGDNEVGRPLRAMDFLSFNLWKHYKSLGFKYIDLGTSTEAGFPNNGLLRFKETHECFSSLRYSFSFTNIINS